MTTTVLPQAYHKPSPLRHRNVLAVLVRSIAYFDMIRVWFNRAVSKAALAKLEDHCGSLQTYFAGDYSRYSPNGYYQCVVFYQPREKVFEWFVERTGILLNAVEFALDYEFRTERLRNAVYLYIHRHLVRPGKNQKVVTFKGSGETRYDACRGAPNKTVLYKTIAARRGCSKMALAFCIWSGAHTVLRPCGALAFGLRNT